MSPFAPPDGRGGPQIIPRPEGARLGGAPPWAGRDLDITESSVRAAVSGRDPGVSFTGAPGARNRDSAVLVPLYVGAANELRMILTRRSPRLRSHTHQVSFPGGAQDPGESLRETALRESEEEIALDPSLVEVIGELDRLQTFTSGSSIVPYVGILRAVPELRASPDEVEAIIDVPVSELLDPSIHREELWPFPKDWGEPVERPIHFFELVGDTVWGATARLIHQLLELSSNPRNW